MKIEREDLLVKLREMKTGGFSYLVKVTAVDYVTYLEVVYILRNLESGNEEMIEIDIDPADAWVSSITGIYKAADWYEREMYEMFGIEIKNRHVKRLLLEKWNGKPAPLRKNFIWSEPYETE
jgi:NADH-quinone oxidoreductase subunit C